MFAERLIRVIKCREKFILNNFDQAIKCISSTCGKNNLFYNDKIFHNINKNESLVYKNTIRYESSYFSPTIQKYHNIIENPEVYSTVRTPLKLDENLDVGSIDDLMSKQWISMSNSELLENFKLLSYHAFKNSIFIHDPKYRGLLDMLTSRCANFSDQELHNLMDYIALWQTEKHEPIYTNFFKCLDKECLKRFPNWSREEILMTNDQFFHMKCARLSDFTWASLKKICRKIHKLSCAQLVHLAFLMRVNRRIAINLYEYEHEVEKYIDKLSLEELKLIITALAKLDYKIQSKDFSIKVLQKINNNIDIIDDYFLVNSLHIFKCFNDPEYEKEFHTLSKSLESQVSSRRTITLANISLYHRKMLIHNDTLMAKILERVENEIKNSNEKFMNISHMESIITALTTFNYDPKTTSFYPTVINEIFSKRLDEIERFPKSLITIVKNLLMVDYYPEEALKYVMNPEFINKTYKNNVHLIEGDYLHLHYNIEIKNRKYNGPKLEEDVLSTLLKKFGSERNDKLVKSLKMSGLHHMTADVIKICQKVLGESAVYKTSLLPHYLRADVVIRYDQETKEFLSPEEELIEIPKGEVKYAPKDGKKWYVLILVPKQSMIRNTGNLTGQVHHYISLLEHIGYTPLIIRHNEWYNMDEQENYIKQILSR